MKKVFYPTEEDIKKFAEACNNNVIRVGRHKTSFSINRSGEYKKFEWNMDFGSYMNKLFSEGFDYLVLNPVSNNTIHVDIADKGNVYDSYTIIKANKKKGFKELIADLSKKRLELYSFVSRFDKGISSGEIINMNEYYRKSNLSSRLSELDEMCLIKVIGEKVNPVTNVLNSVYITVSPEEHKLLREARIKSYTKRIGEIVFDKMNNELSEETVRILNAELKRINLNLKSI